MKTKSRDNRVLYLRRMPFSLRQFGCVALLVLPALTTASSASAQVNVEVLRQGLKDSGFGAKVDFSLTTYLGNTEGTEMGGSALLGQSWSRSLAYLNVSGAYTELGGKTSVSSSFAHLRYNYEVVSWLWAEAFGQIESDHFRRIALRELLGAGPRFAVVNSETVGVFYGAAYMLEHTQLKSGTEPVPGRGELVHRFSNYASFAAQLDDGRVIFSETLYYQPRFDDFGDFHLLSVTELDFKVVGPLNAGVNATLRHETPVPGGVKRTDFVLKNTLGLRF